MKYLDDIPLADALARWNRALDEAGVGALAGTEEVRIEDALGRVLAEPAWARLSSPHYHASAMDGVAVVASATLGAAETKPLRLTIGENASWVDTGDPLPPDRDAVIMIEHVRRIGERTIEIMAPAAPWQHVRSLGEDIVSTEMVVPPGRILSPVDLGALAAAGVGWIRVRRKPRVAVLPTGSELVDRGTEPEPGDIIEFNSLILSGQLEEWGAAPNVLSIVRDDMDLIRDSVRRSCESHDALLIIAGSSAGNEDYTAKIVEALGHLILHGVAIRPGHPQILGIIDGKPVLGMPGYPVSTALNAEVFVRPLIERLLGAVLPERPRTRAALSRKVVSPMGEDEYLRVSLGRVGGRLVAAPLARGAGKITTLSKADGIVMIPASSEGFHAGSEVDVELWRPMREIDQTILAIGSHDLTLDVLASHLAKQHPGTRLVSANVGSLGGLVALQRGEAHMAGCHLLDEETGEYNLPYVTRMLSDRDVAIITLVHRQQGLLVRKGNPKNIESLADTVRPDVRFVNRQRGSGTRILLDFELKNRNVPSDRIAGYEQEEFTHLSVAALIASGAADCGLGIHAAARALGLDFIPVTTERYDLVMLRETWDGELLRPLREAIVSSEELRREIEALGGYDTRRMGKVVS